MREQKNLEQSKRVDTNAIFYLDTAIRPSSCRKDIAAVVVILLFGHERRRYVRDSIRSCTVSFCVDEKLKSVDRKTCNSAHRTANEATRCLVGPTNGECSAARGR